MKILPLVLILNFYSFCYAEGEEKLHLETIGKTLEGIEFELDELTSFLLKSQERERKIFDFRLRMGSLFNNISSENNDKKQLLKSKKELDDFENELDIWIEDVSIEKEKANGSLSILNQNEKSYQESIEKIQVESDEKKTLNKFIKKVKKNKIEFSKKISRLEEHQSYLQDSEKYIEDFKKTLVSRITKGHDRSVFKWKLNSFFQEPIETFTRFIEKNKEIYQHTKNFDYSKFVFENKGNIIIRLIICVVMMILIYSLSFYTGKWLRGSSVHLLDPSFAGILRIFIHNKFIISLVCLLIFIKNDFTIFAYTVYPESLGFFVFVMAFSLIWYKVGHPITNLFAQDANKMQKNGRKFIFNKFIVLLYIAAKSLQAFFDFNNDFLIFINDVLLIWISYKFFILCLRLKIDKQKYESENVAFFLQSAKIFISFLAMSLMISSFVEIVGFIGIGKSLQIIVVSNIFYLAVGWILYQSISYFLESLEKIFKKKKKAKKNLEFVYFFKNALNVFFVLSLLIILWPYLQFFSSIIHLILFFFV